MKIEKTKKKNKKNKKKNSTPNVLVKLCPICLITQVNINNTTMILHSHV